MTDLYETKILPGVYEDCRWGPADEDPGTTLTVVDISRPRYRTVDGKGFYHTTPNQDLLVVDPKVGCIIYTPTPDCVLADDVRILRDPNKPWVFMAGREDCPKFLFNLQAGQE